MTKFNKENLSNLLKVQGLDENELLDNLNNTLKQYSKEDQKEYFELIKDINESYVDIDINNEDNDTKYLDYINKIAEKPYTDFDKIREYHSMMFEINKNRNFEQLFQLIDKDNDIYSYISDYMLENNIYSYDNLYDLMDIMFKDDGMKSPLKYLVNEIEDFDERDYPYLQVNNYGDGFSKKWTSEQELYNDIYWNIEENINKKFFNNLKVQERKLKM